MKYYLKKIYDTGGLTLHRKSSTFDGPLHCPDGTHRTCSEKCPFFDVYYHEVNVNVKLRCRYSVHVLVLDNSDIV